MLYYPRMTGDPKALDHASEMRGGASWTIAYYRFF